MPSKKSVKLDEKELKRRKKRLENGETRQKRLFKYRRAGIVLSKEEVKEIKAQRKKLRHEMKREKRYSKDEFETTAASLGYYFDKRWRLLWWLGSHWLAAALGALAVLIATLLIFSGVQRMRGNYTVSLSDDMFKEGFVLSETEDFALTSSVLTASPADEVPCISIAQIPVDIDEIDGLHNDAYFAYTYYIRNEGDNAAGYVWQLALTSESLDLSEGVWVIVFEDGQMRLYAKVNSETGLAEALPEFGNDSVGYIDLPIMSLAQDSDQFEAIATVGSYTYYRVIPDPFISDEMVATGRQESVEPGEIHKYTVVLYLEGDDPDVDDSMVGGHLGVAMNFYLVDEAADEDSSSGSFWDGFLSFWNSLWSGLAD